MTSLRHPLPLSSRSKAKAFDVPASSETRRPKQSRKRRSPQVFHPPAPSANTTTNSTHSRNLLGSGRPLGTTEAAAAAATTKILPQRTRTRKENIRVADGTNHHDNDRKESPSANIRATSLPSHPGTRHPPHRSTASLPSHPCRPLPHSVKVQATEPKPSSHCAHSAPNRVGAAKDDANNRMHMGQGNQACPMQVGDSKAIRRDPSFVCDSFSEAPNLFEDTTSPFDDYGILEESIDDSDDVRLLMGDCDTF
mmetsp:Transcript_35112/g.65059  ORF Transcript_35112/g.65059 Transcript_35112/m.65059 type:complete len:252 (+) Transcript_35112:252-1007(+)